MKRSLDFMTAGNQPLIEKHDICATPLFLPKETSAGAEDLAVYVANFLSLDPFMRSLIFLANTIACA